MNQLHNNRYILIYHEPAMALFMALTLSFWSSSTMANFPRKLFVLIARESSILFACTS